MSRVNRLLRTTAPVALAFSCAVAILTLRPGHPAAQTTNSDVVYLDQAWSQEDREWYYHFSQGSAVLSYDLFLNIEAADSQDLFRSGLNGPDFGLIPAPASPSNPDGLPIGVSRTTVATSIKGWPAGDYVGINCAACHEGHLKYKGKLIRLKAASQTRSIFRAWLCPEQGASSKFERPAKIRSFSGAAGSIDPGREGQSAQAN